MRKMFYIYIQKYIYFWKYIHFWKHIYIFGNIYIYENISICGIIQPGFFFDLIPVYDDPEADRKDREAAEEGAEVVDVEAELQTGQRATTLKLRLNRVLIWPDIRQIILPTFCEFTNIATLLNTPTVRKKIRETHNFPNKGFTATAKKEKILLRLFKGFL